MTTPADLVLRGSMVYTIDPERRVLDPGLVAVTDGRITRVEPDTGQMVRAADTRWLPHRLLLPGFVNTHAHLVSVLTRGLGGDRFQTGGDPRGRRLTAAIREELDHDLSYAGTRLAVSELLASGVTTTTDSQSARRGLEDGADGTLRALTESGMRAIWYRASVDRTEIVPSHRHDHPDLATAELARLRSAWRSDRIEVGAEALSFHRVSRELLTRLHGWAADEEALFGMHLSYSEETAAHPLKEHGARLMVLLRQWGILDHRFLGYHPIHLDPTEIEALVATDAGVGVCSGANMLIGLHPAPLPQLLAAGVRLGLGTDQPNDGHDFFQTMKTTILHQRASAHSTEFGSPELMLELATIGGARALHREDEIGSIEVGKRADLVVLDTRRPALNPPPGRISNLVYAAGPGEVEAVFVDGEAVVADRQVLAWDPAEVVADVNRAVTRALDRQQIGMEQRSIHRDTGV